MSRGSVREAIRSRRFVALGLVIAIGVCAVLLGVAELGKGWTIALQIGSAVAGAALGNYLRLDAADQEVQSQARPAVRHLFDQVGRLRTLVVRVEGFGERVSVAEKDPSIGPERIADWFNTVGASLRDEINATALAIEHWGDLAGDVQDQELVNFANRDQRLPPHQIEAGN